MQELESAGGPAGSSSPADPDETLEELEAVDPW